MTRFTDMLGAGYGFTEPAIVLGAALEGETVHQEPKIKVPLAMMNRHGLVAGATGTGKTRTLQLLAEQLSAHGVPVFVADIKGDLSGLAVPGQSNERIAGRAQQIGYQWTAAGVPVEFVSLTGALGVQVRATVSSFGPLLLAKALSLNETQTSVLTLVFKYADDSQLPLLDLSDLRAVLQFLTSDEGKAALESHGGMSKATVGVLLRKLVELEAQGAERFFGEPEFDVHDMLRTTSDGRGVVTCLELADTQDKPALFSTFMMWLLAELYHNLPEAGDLPKPKLVFFFDEAHLLFDDAPKAFLDQIQRVVRLIRSKGVGVYLVTQTPKDVPDDVLAQLGNRIQHALRAHTPNDDKALKATVRTYPKTEFYDLEETLTSLGIGEAGAARRPDGAAHAGGAAGGHPPVGPDRGVRAAGGPGERAGDAGEADGGDRGAGGGGRAGAGPGPPGGEDGREGGGRGGGRCADIRDRPDRRARGGARPLRDAGDEAAAHAAEYPQPVVSRAAGRGRGFTTKARRDGGLPWTGLPRLIPLRMSPVRVVV
jgi:hypothetical protein